MQAGHENDYREYLEKVQEMKKKRVEDEKREKAQERAKKDEAARKSKKEKLEKKLISLTKKIAKFFINTLCTRSTRTFGILTMSVEWSTN